MLVLIGGIVALSLGDLVLTMIHLGSTGMVEANPIAAWLFSRTGSLAVLAAYKALTVGVCAGLLYRLRRHAEGEAGAWCAVMILALASLQWYHYTSQVHNLKLATAAGDTRLALD